MIVYLSSYNLDALIKGMSSVTKYQSLEAKVEADDLKQNEELDELCHQVDYDFVSCLHKSIVYQTIEKKDINILYSMLESLNILHQKYTRQLECLYGDIEEIQHDMKDQNKLTKMEKATIPLTLGILYPFLKKNMKKTSNINNQHLNLLINDSEYIKNFVLPTLDDSIKRTHFMIHNFPRPPLIDFETNEL